MTALLTLTTGGVSGVRHALRHVHIMPSILTLKPEQLQNATTVHTVLISGLILPVLMSALNRQLKKDILMPLLLKYPCLLPANRVINISSYNCLFRADINTGRIKPDINTVCTVVAFCSCSGFRVNIDGIIWTCLSACLTPDTPPVVKVNNAVIPHIECTNRTNLDTRCICTVIAAINRKSPPRIWI